jgi:hypothetical protein
MIHNPDETPARSWLERHFTLLLGRQADDSRPGGPRASARVDLFSATDH